MDIVSSLCKSLNIGRKNLGIAGLKDKMGITRQWICIYKTILKQVGGEKKFLDTIGHMCKILEKGRYDKPITIGQNAGNKFQVHLRATPQFTRLDAEKKKKIKEDIKSNIESINCQGFPNGFGQQRFGKGIKNYFLAKELLQKKSFKNTDYEIRFKLQAYTSIFFNTYALSRRKNPKKLLDGDILTNKFNGFDINVGVYQKEKIKLFDYLACKKKFQTKQSFGPDNFSKEIDYEKTWIPTGPMLGTNILLPEVGSESYKQEEYIYKISHFWTDWYRVCEQYKLFGVRRPLRVFPKDIKYTMPHDDIVISFTLPTGCFATVMLGYIFDSIDKETVVQNKLGMPTI